MTKYKYIYISDKRGHHFNIKVVINKRATAGRYEQDERNARRQRERRKLPQQLLGGVVCWCFHYHNHQDITGNLPILRF